MTIRLLLADDQALVRGALSALLGLRERAAALGGTVVTRAVEPSGYALRVLVP